MSMRSAIEKNHSWITVSGSDIAPEFCSYVLPLIQGEPKRLMSHGLPVYAYRK